MQALVLVLALALVLAYLDGSLSRRREKVLKSGTGNGTLSNFSTEAKKPSVARNGR